jgi:hypothetical protein
MGFFSGFRRKIKKLIPKEVRPFLPYAAAMIPGIGGLAGGYGKFVNAALTRGLTDDEADLKDILRTGTFAAAPNIVDSGIGKLNSSKGLGKFLTEAGKANDKGVPGDSIREMVQRYSNPSGFKDTATVIGGQTILDTSAQASDKLDEYNKRMREQGIGNKKERRAAIRKIYEDAGTWDMDEVDAMLDSYGYRTGGRVGYKKGGFEDSEFMDSFAYANEGYDKLKELEDEYELLPIRELRLAKGGEVIEEGYDDGYGPDVPGMFEEIQTTTEEDTSDMMASNPEVMDSLNELSLMLFRRPLDQLSEDEYEELKDFAGQTALKPGLIDEYRNYKYTAEEQGQTPMSPRDYFEMEFGAARMGVARGGIMDVNTNMELDIPGMGREDIDVNSMESIEGQTAGPEWYQERIQNLEYLFGDELTDEEIADIAL